MSITFPGKLLESRLWVVYLPGLLVLSGLFGSLFLVSARVLAEPRIEVHIETDEVMETRRAVLGVNISAGERRGGAVKGVLVVGVTPGGPADKAGILSDDLILSVNGIDMGADVAWRANKKLQRFMRSVEPGDKLKVAYMRGDNTGETTVIAGEVTNEMLPKGYPFSFLDDWDGEISGYGDLPFLFKWRDTSVFSGLELVELTPGLGKYFKADEGLLVVRAPANEKLQIEDGDVIVRIGDRVPRSSDHAMRILESYASGEELKIDIIREKRKRTLSVTLPVADKQSFRFRPRLPRPPRHKLDRPDQPGKPAPAAKT